MKNINHLSIEVQMKLRMKISIMYFCIVFMFSKLIFGIGTIRNLGWKNGIVVFMLICFWVLVTALSAEGTYTYSDPVNQNNKWKYRGIFVIQLLLMGYHSWLIMDNNLSKNKQIKFQICFFIAVLGVMVAHISIIKKYKNMSKTEIIRYMENYKMEFDKELLNKCCGIRQRAIYFLGYMIGISVLFKYFLMNIITSILFLIVNMIILMKLFREPLREIGTIISKKKIYTMGLNVAGIVLTIGYILVYLIYKKYILIPVFEGRTEDEMAMVFLLFYAPVFKYIIEIYTLEIRMERKWEF